MQLHWVGMLVTLGTSCGQTVPMSMYGTVATVEARVNGKGPFRFVIDTGSESCFVVPRVWEAVEARAEYRLELTSTLGGAELVPASKQLRFELGGVAAAGVETLSHELPAVRAAVPGVDGLLGQSFLARFDYLLDYANQRLAFGDRLEGLRLPVKRDANRLLVSATAGRRTVQLVLDSGASQLVLRTTTPPDPSHHGNDLIIGNVAATAVTRGQIKRFAIGDAVFHHLDVAYFPGGSDSCADGLLPTALFKKVYVNNAMEYLVLAP